MATQREILRAEIQTMLLEVLTDMDRAVLVAVCLHLAQSLAELRSYTDLLAWHRKLRRMVEEKRARDREPARP